jgi:hypothetical protein
MFRRTTVPVLAVVLGLGLSSPLAAADNEPESSLLNVTAQFSTGSATDCKAGDGVAVQLRYAGSQPLRGYLVRLVLADMVTGEVRLERSVQEIRDSQQPMIASGTEWTRTVCSIPKKISERPMTLAAKVDVLKFADNSTWGPAALRESHQLVGALDGMDFIAKTTELKRFVSPILPERGPVPVEGIESQTLGPLRIESGIWRDERGQDMLAVEVTNESVKPIRGYLLTTSFLDPATGNRIRRFSTKELDTSGNPADYLAPGSTWVADPRKFSHLSDGTLASYKIDLDVVVFADGSTFGPKKSQESDEVLGMFNGIDAANLLNREGSAARDLESRPR